MYFAGGTKDGVDGGFVDAQVPGAEGGFHHIGVVTGPQCPGHVTVIPRPGTMLEGRVLLDRVR